VVIQKRRKKNWHKAKFHGRALSQLIQLMRSKPRIRTDEVEIKVYMVHEHCMLSHYHHFLNLRFWPKADIGTASNVSTLAAAIPGGLKTCLMQIGCYIFGSL
jgi:hypothetical protein